MCPSSSGGPAAADNRRLRPLLDHTAPACGSACAGTGGRCAGRGRRARRAAAEIGAQLRVWPPWPQGLTALGGEERAQWSSWFGVGREVTCMVDLTGDQDDQDDQVRGPPAGPGAERSWSPCAGRSDVHQRRSPGPGPVLPCPIRSPAPDSVPRCATACPAWCGDRRPFASSRPGPKPWTRSAAGHGGAGAATAATRCARPVVRCHRARGPGRRPALPARRRAGRRRPGRRGGALLIPSPAAPRDPQHWRQPERAPRPAGELVTAPGHGAPAGAAGAAG